MSLLLIAATLLRNAPLPLAHQHYEQLRLLSQHLSTRRDAILEAARAAARRDPQLTTADSLTRAQFRDHLPRVLHAFERKLRAGPNRESTASAEEEEKDEEIKHGLHRWQQGYQLRELLHEWGHLHHCLFDELEAFAAAHPNVERSTLAEANRHLIGLVNEAISESTAQYARLQQDEAAGHLRDLQAAVDAFQEAERRRNELIRQAVHDLRGNVQTVSSAAEVLRDVDIPTVERALFIDLLQQGADSLSTMVGELMDLARLEAGKEERDIAPFDAAALVTEFCKTTEPVATERGLYLRMNGPDALPVGGDQTKVRRILQNLVLNAVKYTVTGGITVSWGEELPKSWWIMIEDTGPGLLAGPGAPMVTNLKEATASARESEEEGVKEKNGSSHVLPLPEGSSEPNPRRPHQQPGEGIGLSIVKRLCELLDASVELASSATSGTTFRIVFPRRYE